MAVANMAMVMISSILSPRRPLLTACFILLSPFLLPIFVLSFPFVLTTSVLSMCFLRCFRFVLRIGFSRFSTSKRRIAAQGLRSSHRCTDAKSKTLIYDELCRSDNILGFLKDKNSIFYVRGGKAGFPEGAGRFPFVKGKNSVDGDIFEVSEGKFFLNGRRLDLHEGKNSGIFVNGERIMLSESRISEMVANGAKFVHFPARSDEKTVSGRIFDGESCEEEEEGENGKNMRLHEYLEDQFRSLDNMQVMSLPWRRSNSDEDFDVDYTVFDGDESAASSGCFSVQNGDGEDPPLPCSFSPKPCLID